MLTVLKNKTIRFVLSILAVGLIVLFSYIGLTGTPTEADIEKITTQAQNQFWDAIEASGRCIGSSFETHDEVCSEVQATYDTYNETVLERDQMLAQYEKNK